MRAAIEASTSAPTSRSSPRSTPSGATRARRKVASTRPLGTRPTTTPRSTPSTPSRARTTSATRTRSRCSATRRPDDVYQLEHWGAVFSRTPDGRIAQRPFGAAGEPRTAYAADITGHVLLQVLYEQIVKRDLLGVRRVVRVAARSRRRPLPGRRLLGPRQRRPEDDRRKDGHPLYRRRRAAVCRHDERVRVHGRRHGTGSARRCPAEGHGDDAVPPDDPRANGCPDHGRLPRRGRIPPELRGRPLPQELCPERDGARLARRHLPRGADRDRRGPRASTATSSSICATSARRRSSSASTGHASSR